MGFVLRRYFGEAAYELAFATGFLLVAPFLAMGMYEISRRRERGQPIALLETLTAWKVNLPAIGFYAVILALLMAVWIRVSVVVVALFCGDSVAMGQQTVGSISRTVECAQPVTRNP